MAGLGVVVTLGGYLLLNLGYYMVKGVNVGIGDLILPSRKAGTLATIAAGPGGGSGAPSPTAGQANASGLGQPPQIVTSGPNAGEIAGGTPNPVWLNNQQSLQAIFGGPAGVG